jgi:hypothetical protein
MRRLHLLRQYSLYLVRLIITLLLRTYLFMRRRRRILTKRTRLTIRIMFERQFGLHFSNDDIDNGKIHSNDHWNISSFYHYRSLSIME